MAAGGGWSALSALAQGTATTIEATERPRLVIGDGERRIALLVPRRDGPFARAAESIVAGVTAAYAQVGAGLRIEAFEVDDQSDQLAAAFGEIESRRFHMVLGPITRSGANALLALGEPRVPTVALNYPDGEPAIPPNLVFFGFGIEAETRQVASMAWANALARATNRAPRAVVVSLTSPVARRSAAAFREQWQALGGQVREPLEFPGPRPPPDIRNRVRNPLPDAVFLAMGPEEARALRQSIGPGLPAFGNSLLSSGGSASLLRFPELDGVRVVEMPSLVQPDSAVVIAFDRPPPAFNLEMQRLHALGVDGLRVVWQLLSSNDPFQMEGLTGQLIYDPRVAPRVDRLALPAVYRNGVPVPLES
jgi:outer membrane PBP1 activator LpoA protein